MWYLGEMAYKKKSMHFSELISLIGTNIDHNYLPSTMEVKYNVLYIGTKDSCEVTNNIASRIIHPSTVYTGEIMMGSNKCRIEIEQEFTSEIYTLQGQN